MIIKIKGGLGNQMFQYALGRNIALINEEEVKFDLSWFEQYKARTHKLHHFNVAEHFATEKEVRKKRRYEKKAGGLSFFYNYFIANDSIYIKQKGFDFNPEILKIKGPVYLDGHWQSERYFENIKNTIRKEFTLKNKPTNNYKDIEYSIGRKDSISLHIRRGDYLTMRKAAETIGICPLDYYQRAIEKITGEIENPTFFIFSDDIGWAKENIRTNSPIVFVSDNKLEDYEELILMSKCKHNIISNSSFGWWGAWLNNNPGKIIISPKKWFKDSSKNTKDLIPESWTQL